MTAPDPNWAAKLSQNPKEAANVAASLRAKAAADRASAAKAEELAAVLEGVATPPEGTDHVKKMIQNGSRLVVTADVNGQSVRLSGHVTRIFDTFGKPGQLGIELFEADVVLGPEGKTL
jgi:hypothetical protein